jgi:hypothetical protein
MRTWSSWLKKPEPPLGAVEVARRLVGQEERRLRDDRTIEAALRLELVEGAPALIRRDDEDDPMIA